MLIVILSDSEESSKSDVRFAFLVKKILRYRSG